MFKFNRNRFIFFFGLCMILLNPMQAKAMDWTDAFAGQLGYQYGLVFNDMNVDPTNSILSTAGIIGDPNIYFTNFPSFVTATYPIIGSWWPHALASNIMAISTYDGTMALPPMTTTSYINGDNQLATVDFDPNIIGQFYQSGSFSGTFFMDPLDQFCTNTPSSCIHANQKDTFIRAMNYSTLLWSKVVARSTSTSSATSGTGRIIASDVATIGSTTILTPVGVWSGKNVDFSASNSSTLLKSAPGTDNSFLSVFDNNGNRLWSKFLINGPLVSDVAINRLNGNITLVGTIVPHASTFIDGWTGAIPSFGGTDAFALTYSRNGALVNFRVWGGTGADSAKSVYLDHATGEVYIVGSFNGTTDFDPNFSRSGADIITSMGGSDSYLLKLTPNFVFNYVRTVPGTLTEDSFEKVIVGGCGQVWAIGVYDSVKPKVKLIRFSPTGNVTQNYEFNYHNVGIQGENLAMIGNGKLVASASFFDTYTLPGYNIVSGHADTLISTVSDQLCP